MRPDGVSRGAFGITVTGIIEKGHVHKTVPVGVVDREIHLIGQNNAGIEQSQFRPNVRALTASVFPAAPSTNSTAEANASALVFFKFIFIPIPPISSKQETF